MTDRATIEKTLRAAYDARCRGDVETICGIFCDSVHYEMAGSKEASPMPARVKGGADFRHVLEQQIKIFRMTDPEILSMVIEGQKAAVRWRAKVHSTVTGKTATTELFDFIEFKDGRIESFVELCDTAMAAKMMAPAPAPTLQVTLSERV